MQRVNYVLLYNPANCVSSLFARNISSTHSLRIWHHLNIVSAYEDFIGLTDVKDAQSQVRKAEDAFSVAQQERRERQRQLNETQMKLRSLQVELDKVHRGDEKYLVLLTKEHSIIKEENALQKEVAFLEKSERETFSRLSTNVRDSHEKERSRAEKTKYWGLIGSVGCALIGVIGTSISYRARSKQLGSVLDAAKTQTSALEQTVISLSDAVTHQQSSYQTFTNDIKTLLGAKVNDDDSTAVPLVGHDNTALLSLSQSILEEVRRHDSVFEKETEVVKELIRANVLEEGDSKLVLGGAQVQAMLDESQKNMEWKMKMNSLATAVLIYGFCALSLPLVYNLFRT